MNLIKYLFDKKMIIIIFTLNMIFIDTIFYLDPKTSVTDSNILYVNLFAILILFIYLLTDYIRINNMLKRITDQDTNIFHSLSDRMDNEHRFYYHLLKEAYEKIENEKTLMKSEKKEYSEFIEKWVHEIKTPVSVLSLIVENENAISENYKLSISEELIKITDNIERVLYFSKLDSFNQDYFLEKSDIYKVTRDVIKSNAQLFIQKNISIKINAQGLFITTDKKWLRFIIYQIIINSLKYTPHGGKIEIDHVETISEIFFTITDSGCGIRPEDINRIFNRGFTGYNGRQNNNSTGFGLYISKKLADKLNIKLSAESDWGSYTKIILTFPKEHDFFKVTEV